MDKNEQNWQYFPFYVKMDGSHIVLFGAGEIASRRAAVLVKTTCCLTVIAPECGEEMRKLLDVSADRCIRRADRLCEGYLPQRMPHGGGYGRGNRSDE